MTGCKIDINNEPKSLFEKHVKPITQAGKNDLMTANSFSSFCSERNLKKKYEYYVKIFFEAWNEEPTEGIIQRCQAFFQKTNKSSFSECDISLFGITMNLLSALSVTSLIQYSSNWFFRIRRKLFIYITYLSTWLKFCRSVLTIRLPRNVYKSSNFGIDAYKEHQRKVKLIQFFLNSVIISEGGIHKQG